MNASPHSPKDALDGAGADKAHPPGHPAHGWRWVRSLRWRLLSLTVVGLTLALALAGVLLAGLFKEHVKQQFQASLLTQLDQLTASLSVDAQGRPDVPLASLTDPRWRRPYSGLYWQIDEMSRDGHSREGVLRSRSLWDARLNLEADPIKDGAVHVHAAKGPAGQELLVVERVVQAEAVTSSRWRLVVAGDLRDTQAAVAGFTRVLSLSLAALLVLLSLAAWAQVAVGLRPLRGLQDAVQAVRDGRDRRLQGRFPQEVQALVDDFNGVLDRNEAVVDRARAQAGNLAHALKTPLSVLEQVASQAGTDGLASLLRDQCGIARRHIDWHLARARMAATQGRPGQSTDVAPVLAGLVRVMEKVHADRQLHIALRVADACPPFAGEAQDLQEVLGNVIDNACKWAATHVEVTLASSGDGLLVQVEDDGPGIDEASLDAVMTRGVRLDEAVPGSGLGLAIAKELVDLYGGTLALRNLQEGGLEVTLRLPALRSAPDQTRR